MDAPSVGLAVEGDSASICISSVPVLDLILLFFVHSAFFNFAAINGLHPSWSLEPRCDEDDRWVTMTLGCRLRHVLNDHSMYGAIHPHRFWPMSPNHLLVLFSSKWSLFLTQNESFFFFCMKWPLIII